MTGSRAQNLSEQVSQAHMREKLAHAMKTLASSVTFPFHYKPDYLIRKLVPLCLFGVNKPQRLTVTLLDLHLAQPALAHEFYHGRFALAGRIVRTGSISPWQVVAPSQKWEEELHDFSWLRHMSAAKTAIASAHARILVDEWISLTDKNKGSIAWSAQVAARRTISWLSHADMLLADAHDGFQRRFFKTLKFNIRYLQLIRPFIAEKMHASVLDVHMALCFAALALACTPAQLHAAESRLERVLQRHILPDGGHMSRNPAALIPILADLVALCHGYQQANYPIPKSFLDFLERIDQALRFFLHRDNSLANFNGVGPLLPERLNKLLNIHAPPPPLPTQLTSSGYQRLAGGPTTVIMDTGYMPQKQLKSLSATAHAGCLSFEMSSSAHRFIVNCGIDPNSSGEFDYFGRLTAAHSTATLNDTSSCRFHHIGQTDTLILDGPDRVRIKHIKHSTCHGLIACHNGYEKTFNLLHQRSIALSRDGNLLQGADRFLKTNPEQKMEPIMTTVRFHLHPDVEVSQLDEKSLRLEVMRADIWLVTCQAEMTLEESIYFCDLQGPTRTKQIVFSFDAASGQEIYWEFRRQIRDAGQTSPFQTRSLSTSQYL